MRRCLTLFLLVVALAWPPIAATAGVEFDAALGRTGIGRCHMDECTFFVLDTSLPIAVLKDGTLFAVSETVWSAEYKAHGDDDAHEYDRPPVSIGTKTRDGFVIFCSKARPHIFFYGDGKWDALALRPGDDAAVFGAAESAYSTYWAACHHFITKDPTSAKMAAKLGYHFSGGPVDQDADPIKRPSDIMK